MKTVNGKPLNEVIDALQAPFPEDVILTKKGTGFKYAPVEAYQDRIDSVIGAGNYDFVTESPNLITVRNASAVSISGQISIRDDEGNVVCSKGGTGGAKIIIVKETNEPKDLANDIKSATSDLFKSCCQKFGIGAEIKKMNDDANGSDEQAIQPTKVFIISGFKSMGTNGYKATAMKENGQKIALVFWQDAVGEVEKKCSFDEFSKIYTATEQKPKGLTVKGYEKTYKDELQFVVKGLVAKTN